MGTRPNCLVEFFSYPCPLLRLIQIAGHALSGNFFSDLLKNFRFSGGPRRLFALDVLDEQPALLALEGRAAGHQVGHRLPVRVREVLDEGVALVSHIENDVLQQHRFIFLPLRVRLSQFRAGVGTVGRVVAVVVILHALGVTGGLLAGARGRLSVLLLAEDLVVLGVDTIGFALVYNAPLVQKIVAVFESNYFLLFVGVDGLSGHHARLLVVEAGVADHIVREVDHGADLLLRVLPHLGSWLVRNVLHLLLVGTVKRRVKRSRLHLHHLARHLWLLAHLHLLHLLAEGELLFAGHALPSGALASAAAEEVLLQRRRRLTRLLNHLLGDLTLCAHANDWLLLLHSLDLLRLILVRLLLHVRGHLRRRRLLRHLLLHRAWIAWEVHAWRDLALVADERWHGCLHCLALGLHHGSRRLVAHIDGVVHRLLRHIELRLFQFGVFVLRVHSSAALVLVIDLAHVVHERVLGASHVWLGCIFGVLLRIKALKNKIVVSKNI